MLGEVLQERDEVGAVVLADSREQFCLVLVGDTLGTAEQVVGGAGEVDRVGTPIGGVAAAFDESSILEFVDEADHHVAVDAHGVCEPLLGLPLASREVHEQSEVTRPHAQRRQALGELMRAIRAELGQQEAGSAGQRVNPESFTHGTAEQRVRWLRRGLDAGDPGDCDTFKGDL